MSFVRPVSKPLVYYSDSFNIPSVAMQMQNFSDVDRKDHLLVASPCYFIFASLLVIFFQVNESLNFKTIRSETILYLLFFAANFFL